jgi:hypothetical protein
LGQCPPTILALALVAIKLQLPTHEGSQKQSYTSKLRRIDFLGAILLAASIVCGLLVLDMVGQRVAWTDPKFLTIFGASLVTGNLFLVVEGFWAKEPLFPLRLLLNRDVIVSYVNLAFQSGAQTAVSLLHLDSTPQKTYLRRR